jgi:hypothetical protein
MSRFGQVGIALGALGAVLTFMGLFPGVTGLAPTIGIGVVQVFLILIGYSLLLLGAYVYVKFTFYAGVRGNLIQQIGNRLAATGVLFASLCGLADIFGFGSHNRTAITDIFLGQLQAFGVIASFFVASSGILIFAIAGWRQMRLEAPPDEADSSEIPIPASATQTQPAQKVVVNDVPQP